MENASPDLWVTFFKSIMMLAVVLAVLIGGVYCLRVLMQNKLPAGKDAVIKSLATHYLAPKEKVVLLDVLGEKILLGVTAQSIQCLAVFDASDRIQNHNSTPRNESGNKTGSHDQPKAHHVTANS
ncbi:flagellar biosynthetic protein FliO [Desulfobacterales bacterium HSG17]|nr:flagellar biosynthetic protein FliO [Desulfobacterales bacterium HSG17]